MATPIIAFGGGIFTPPYVKDVEEVQEYLDLLAELGIKIIDTAALYGESEKFLGEKKAASRFTIDTKHPGLMQPEPSTKDVVIASGKESLKKLATSQVCAHATPNQRRLDFQYGIDVLIALYYVGRCILSPQPRHSPPC
jgi:aryl-alcohol dehydrogenase-like predicted oxidoreductase